MAVAPSIGFLDLDCAASFKGPLAASAKASQLAEIAGVYRGRELTRKDRRTGSGIAPIDALIGGGIVRGRISEIIGPAGCGSASLAAAFAAVASRRGEATAWLDTTGGFDPASIALAGADLARILWVAAAPRRGGAALADEGDTPRRSRNERNARRTPAVAALKAAEWIMAAGGFGLIVIDLGASGAPLAASVALRLAHRAERGGAAVLILAAHRMCGTFAALTIALVRNRASFSRSGPGAPALFDGLTVEARVTRNKLGGSGGAATWRALADPAAAIISAVTPAINHAIAPAITPASARPDAIAIAAARGPRRAAR
jgi:protein ImuA